LNQNIDLPEMDYKKLLPSGSDIISMLETFLNTNQKIEFNLYRMKTAENLFGLVCRIKDIPHNKIFYGFALREDLEKSIRSSFYEAVNNFAYFKDNSTAYADIIHDKSHLWQLHDGFVAKIAQILSKKSVSQAALPLPQVFEINLNIIPILELRSCPISPIQALIKPGQS
jgi:hypothetical protein